MSAVWIYSSWVWSRTKYSLIHLRRVGIDTPKSLTLARLIIFDCQTTSIVQTAWIDCKTTKIGRDIPQESGSVPYKPIPAHNLSILTWWCIYIPSFCKKSRQLLLLRLSLCCPCCWRKDIICWKTQIGPIFCVAHILILTLLAFSGTGLSILALFCNMHLYHDDQYSSSIFFFRPKLFIRISDKLFYFNFM